MTNAKTYTLGTLAELLQVELIGDPDCVIDGLATLQQASPGKLGFLSNPSYAKQLSNCKASAVIIAPRHIEACKLNKLVSETPYVIYARASQLFDNSLSASSTVHSTAVVNEYAELADDVSIGPNAVIEADVVIGPGSNIGPGCIVGEGSLIGEGCQLYSNVTIYHRVKLGNRVVIHSGAVIGADGFGFAFDGEKSIKIAQLGSVQIADDVEVGAGTTIDRGALDDTVIEQGVKIDNQVQIGHNCIIGAHSVICGCAAIAGSVVIGKYCVLGGGSGVVGHIRIADRVKVSAMSLVSQAIDTAGTYSSGTGIMETARWKKNIVRFRQLDDISKRLRSMENTKKKTPE